MKRQMIFSVLLGSTIYNLQAQEKLEKENPITISGYVEIYDQYDFANPKQNNRPGFVYSHHRNNEVNVNLGLIKVNYETERIRTNLALGVGTYVQANYAAEPAALKNIYEANVGVKLSEKHNLWIDVGVLPSHIGFESAISKDCYTLTRSIGADNSPYFETGAKLSYTTADGKWMLSGLLLNGWQRIQRVDGNSTPAFGHQLTYKPNEKITLNSSSFVGSDQADSVRKMRYFHHFYGQFQLHDQFVLITGLDIGAQQKEKGSTAYYTWFTPVLIASYKPFDRWGCALRGEYYQDKNGVMIATGTADGFQTFGYSFTLDYQILSNLIWRTELKKLQSKDPIFVDREDVLRKDNVIGITSLSIRF
ncbi:porin [Sphingobacterium sp. SRCM116780]|uniref:porin n=1 Tax=Sphingobacterium sp. SRCM116780 TaxID=2907623 RepID=UPI001F200C66|nr:porin [Sphingobacterium sp. SRCM116780]UIR57090.1 porin [Sphingobacterium sp. SRCM116780]